VQQYALPGASLASAALTNFRAGNYGWAAADAAGSLVDAGLFLGSFGLSTGVETTVQGFTAAADNTVTVGRMMSQTEFDAMQSSGRLQESFNNGVTSVTLPPNIGAYRAAPVGDVFVQFDLPEAAIGASDGTIAKIYGPSSLLGQAKGITEMPAVTNILVPPL
jgi:hypothetical protein